HGLSGLVARICGQEVGTKKEILRIAKDYPAGHCLMLGDAPGDLQAARANGVLFFPINPGAEDASWKRFYEEGLDRFFRGSYAGEYEASLVAEFDARLPASPPWKT
ncbi:MAG TPA: HAD family hydrolase, partial [Planctomycetia bacterium]|nr:HAD family hydrolase [Planctomycetia bacterium]